MKAKKSEEPPPSENAQADSYFKKTQKTLQYKKRHDSQSPFLNAPDEFLVRLFC